MTAQLDAVSTGGSHLFADSLVQGFNVDPARANEIASLSARDLADLRADRGEMLRHAYKQIYG